jgi:hypothetical protein
MITILQQGTEAKVQVSIKDFDMRFGDFSVSLIYGYRRTVVEIPKSAMVHDDDWNFFFTFATDGMVGKVVARCEWREMDDDYPDAWKDNVDEQYLCFVVSDPCPRFIACPACEHSDRVTYKFTDEPNIRERYLYLCDSEHNRIVTSDGMNILVLKQQ